MKQDEEILNGHVQASPVTNGLQSEVDRGEGGGGEMAEKTEEELEDIRRKQHEEMIRQLDEENKDKYKCKLCVKKPKYFEKLFEIHEHLLEFHIVPNNEEDVEQQ